MAREMLLAGVDPEELKPAEKIQPPTTPRGKWENFWYHYKWHFWGGLFGVVVLTVMAVQLLTKNPVDYHIVMVTEYSLLDGQVEQLEQQLEAYGVDVDGDGEVEVQIQNCYLLNPGTQEYFANQNAIQSHVFAGDVMLFAWEPKYYQEFITNIHNSSEDDFEFLQPLPFAAQGISEDGRVWNWQGDSRLNKPELQPLPEQLYFGVRTSDGTAAGQIEIRDACLQLLEAYATDTKPVKKAE